MQVCASSRGEGADSEATSTVDQAGEAVRGAAEKAGKSLRQLGQDAEGAAGDTAESAKKARALFSLALRLVFVRQQFPLVLPLASTSPLLQVSPFLTPYNTTLKCSHMQHWMDKRLHYLQVIAALVQASPSRRGLQALLSAAWARSLPHSSAFAGCRLQAADSGGATAQTTKNAGDAVKQAAGQDGIPDFDLPTAVAMGVCSFEVLAPGYSLAAS